jgi:NAD(P)-dependent dehydrogenase (short-subunit alcohol dehydrogenase family)
MADTENRVAIVTGAAGGLGSAVARLLASSAHDLVLVDNRSDDLAAIAVEAGERGGRVEQMVVDLSVVEECERLVEETIHQLGRVDILVNSAAILARRELDEITAESFDEIFHTNARAPFFLMRAAIRDMAKRSWGRIVNMTSSGVYTGGHNMTSAPYEASKGAVSVLTKMFARHTGAKGILVNAVCPGGMRTRMRDEGTPPGVIEEIDKQIPLQRTCDPVEVARMVVWLCGDENSYATGATFDILGGRVMR